MHLDLGPSIFRIQNSQEFQNQEEQVKGKNLGFNCLPSEALEQIFQNLDVVSLCRLAQVSKNFKASVLEFEKKSEIWEKNLQDLMQTIGQRLIQQNEKIMQLLSHPNNNKNPDLKNYLNLAKEDWMLSKHLTVENLQRCNDQIAGILKNQNLDYFKTIYTHYDSNYALLTDYPIYHSQILHTAKWLREMRPLNRSMNPIKRIFLDTFHNELNFSFPYWEYLLMYNGSLRPIKKLGIIPLLDLYHRIPFQDQGINQLFFRTIYYLLGDNASFQENKQKRFQKFCSTIQEVFKQNSQHTLSIICSLPRTKERLVKIIEPCAIDRKYYKQILCSELDQKENFTSQRLQDLQSLEDPSLPLSLLAQAQIDCLNSVLSNYPQATCSWLLEKVDQMTQEKRYELAKFMALIIGTMVTNYMKDFDLTDEKHRLDIYTCALNKGAFKDYSIIKMWEALAIFQLTNLSQQQVLEFSQQIFEKSYEGRAFPNYFAFQETSSLKLDIEHQIKLVEFLTETKPFELIRNLEKFKLKAQLPLEEYEPLIDKIFYSVISKEELSPAFKRKMPSLIRKLFKKEKEIQKEIIERFKGYISRREGSLGNYAKSSHRKLADEIQNSEDSLCGSKRKRPPSTLNASPPQKKQKNEPISISQKDEKVQNSD